MRLLVPLKVVEVVTGVVALITVKLPHVFMDFNDMLIKDLLVRSLKLLAVGTGMEFASFPTQSMLCFQVYLHLVLFVRLIFTLGTAILIKFKMFGFIVEFKFFSRRC